MFQWRLYIILLPEVLLLYANSSYCIQKKTVTAPNVNKSQGDNGRAAARSRLAAIKAAMKNIVQQEEIVEEATVSEEPVQVGTLVFDAGFFRIESPAKLPGSK